MPEIDNAQVAAFANDRVRPMADKLHGAYYSALVMLEEYNVGNIGSLIDAAGAGNLIADGSDVDGRTRITGGDVYNLMTAVQAFVAFVADGVVSQADRTDVITKPHVNTVLF